MSEFLIKLQKYELIFNTNNQALSIENIEDVKKKDGSY